MKVIICDDSPREQERYAQQLNQIAEKFNINIELVLFNSATQLLFEAQDPRFAADLIYMDVHMPGITGDEAALKLRELGYQNELIFLTVSKNHFRDAFDANALHYIVKGETNPEEFERIFLRAIYNIEENADKYALYSGGGELRKIKLSTVKYYEIYRKIVTVHYGDTSFQFPQISLEKLQNELEEHGFYRIHKSILVSLRAIESLNFKEATLFDGTVLPLRRGCYAELKEKLASM